MSDGIGLAEALLGLIGFRVLEVHENRNEVVIVVETTAEIVGCARCGTTPVAHERMRVDKSWRNEILAHHTTGADNGRTEGLKLCVKKVKRCAHQCAPSSTAGSASFSTPAVSPGRDDTARLGSEPVFPYSNA